MNKNFTETNWLINIFLKQVKICWWQILLNKKSNKSLKNL